jgi:hypothetical protein
MKTGIQMLSGGRFLSAHIGALVYFDQRHKIIKTKLSDGSFAELVQERQSDGSYRDQILTIRNEETSILEYKR